MVEAELKYPDQIDDIVNRASTLFVTGLMAAKNQELDLTQMNFLDLGDEREVEDQTFFCSMYKYGAAVQGSCLLAISNAFSMLAPASKAPIARLDPLPTP